MTRAHTPQRNAPDRPIPCCARQPSAEVVGAADQRPRRNAPFDLHPDGDRVVMGGDMAGTTKVDKIVLVTNVFGELRRRSSDGSR